MTVVFALLAALCNALNVITQHAERFFPGRRESLPAEQVHGEPTRPAQPPAEPDRADPARTDPQSADPA